MKKILLIILVCVAFVATAMCQVTDSISVNNIVNVDQSLIDSFAKTITGWLIAYATVKPIWFSIISILLIILLAGSEYLGQTKRFASNSIIQAIIAILKAVWRIFTVSKKF